MARRAAALAIAFVAPAAKAQAPCDVAPAQPMSLAVAEARMLECNRDVRASRTAVDAAAADLRVAGQRPNPTMTLAASNVNPAVGVGSGPLRDKTFDSSLRMEQLVERGGKPALRQGQAQSLLDAARLDLAEQRRVQRLALRETYFDLAAAQEKLRLQREFLTLAEGSAAAAQRRLEAGEVSRAEAGRFRLDAVRAANDARQAAADAERGAFDLAKLVGAEAFAASIRVIVAWPERESAVGSQDDRPDVAAARKRLAAAEYGRDLARAIATRDVTLGVQADHWPASALNPQGTGISYGLSIEIPLHVRHANEGEAARAMADLEAARGTLERALAQANADRALASRQLAAAQERRRRLEAEALPAAREIAEGAEYAYSRGATSVFELLDARRSLKGVELDELQARADAAKAWARREAAMERAP